MSAATDGGFEDLPFGRANTWRATLSFSQNLYSGGRIGAQPAMAAAGRDAAEPRADDDARRSCCSTSTQAYYDAALSDRLVAIAEATLEQADATLQQAQAGFDAGTQPEFEVLRARVTRDNQTPLLIRQRVNREIALLRLKQLLDLPPTLDLQLPTRSATSSCAPPPAVRRAGRRGRSGVARPAEASVVARCRRRRCPSARPSTEAAADGAACAKRRCSWPRRSGCRA